MKNSIGNYLWTLAIGILIGFLLCLYSKTDNKKNGERPLEPIHQSTKIEHNKIDSLETIIQESDKKITKFHKKKSLIINNYEKSIANIDTMGFDSLSILFTKFYPRTINK